MMKNSMLVVLMLFLLFACESPEMGQTQDLVYRGQVVLEQPAPFLLPGGLAKETQETVILEETTSEATVYGLIDDETVYLAAGGEILPRGVWVGSLDTEPIEASLTADALIRFESLATVTILDAENMYYIDENGQSLSFSGAGIISTHEITIGADGFALLVTCAQFSIGGEGTDTQ